MFFHRQRCVVHGTRFRLSSRGPLLKRAANSSYGFLLIALLPKDRLSDAGGLGFESQTGWVTGKFTPSLWRDQHPAIKGLRPPEHHAGQFHPDQETARSQASKAREATNTCDSYKCLPCPRWVQVFPGSVTDLCTVSFGAGGRRHEQLVADPTPNLPTVLTLSLLRLLDSKFPGNPLWAWEYHPLQLRLCLSQTL